MITNGDRNVQTILHEIGFISDKAKNDEAVQHAPLWICDHTHTNTHHIAMHAFCYRQQTSHHMWALVHDNGSIGHKRQ